MSSHIIDLIWAFLLFFAAAIYISKADWFKCLVLFALGSILINVVAISIGVKS